MRVGDSDGSLDDRPAYDRSRVHLDRVRGPIAHKFAEQILATTRPFRSVPDESARVLDVGSGYGHTALALSRRVKSVVGAEPNQHLYRSARRLQEERRVSNVEFRNVGVESIREVDTYDIIVLDNVFEHLPSQLTSLRIIHRALAPRGVLYLLTPNRLWPIEVHYGLPFLSYLTVPLANRYLRLAGRGDDYTDASYARTYWSLSRMLKSIGGWRFEFALPADLSLTTLGSAWHYRLGASLIKLQPWLWAFSKALLVVAVKDER